MSIFPPFSFSRSRYHRGLYSQAFIDSGCNAALLGGEEGVDLTTIDDTVGTWVTNYVILAVGLFGVFVFSCQRDPKGPLKQFVFTSSYFGFTGLGYGLAAVDHQTRKLRTDPKFCATAAYILTALGALSLQLQISMNFKASGIAQHCYTQLVLVVGLAVIVVLAIWSNIIVAGTYLVVSHLWFTLYYAYLRDWMASVGSIITVVGVAVQFFLLSTCGDNGYENCFKDCLLPDPMNFNHNALFHSIVALAMVLQLFARFVPIVSSSSSGGRGLIGSGTYFLPGTSQN